MRSLPFLFCASLGLLAAPTQQPSHFACPLLASPPPPAGVYGRVAHLAEIRDKRYVLAVTAAMGRDFDGIIVKDGEPFPLLVC